MISLHREIPTTLSNYAALVSYPKPAHDSIADSGATYCYFPHFLSPLMHSLQPTSQFEPITCGNLGQLYITHTAYLGIFPICIVPHILKPLISENFLTYYFDILILKYDSTMWILDTMKLLSSNFNPTAVIATLDTANDGLSYFRNLHDLAHAQPRQTKPILNFPPPTSSSRLTTSDFNSKDHISSGAISLFNPTQTPQVHLSSSSMQRNRGRYQGRFSKLLGDLNPLEVLHVRLGHLSDATLRSLITHNVVDGLDVTPDDLRKHKLGSCYADWIGKMQAFPIYPSLKNHSPDLFEHWSVDDVPMPTVSIEGYKGFFAFREQTTIFADAYGYTTSISELPIVMDKLILKYGPRQNKKCKPIKALILDGSKTNIGHALAQWCQNNDNPLDPIVRRLISAPHKHEQNLIETSVGPMKDTMRVNLAYNKAPQSLWFKAIKYGNRNNNLNTAPNTTISRHECLTGHRPNVSHYVPFYATGYAHCPKELRSNTLSPKAIRVKMIGYGDDLDDQTDPNIQYKRCFQCYIPPRRILIRHDVVWEHLSPEPSLLHPDIRNRFPETFTTDTALEDVLNEAFPDTHSTTVNETNSSVNPLSDATSGSYSIPLPPLIAYDSDDDDHTTDLPGIQTRSSENYWFQAKSAHRNFSSALTPPTGVQDFTSVNSRYQPISAQGNVRYPLSPLHSPIGVHSELSSVLSRAKPFSGQGAHVSSSVLTNPIPESNKICMSTSDEKPLVHTGPKGSYVSTNPNTGIRRRSSENYWFQALSDHGRYTSSAFTDPTTPPPDRRAWFKTLLSYFSTPLPMNNSNADLSHSPTPHNLVRSDGTICVSPGHLPTHITSDIMSDYNRPIRDILLRHKTFVNHQFYTDDNPPSTRHSYFNHPDSNKTLSPTPYNTINHVNIHAFNPHAPILTPPKPAHFTTQLLNMATPILHIPLTLSEALSGPDSKLWFDAWQQEMSRLQSRNTWAPLPSTSTGGQTPPPQNQRPIKSKYIFKIKVNPDNTCRYKVRLVACGYSQKYGIDYDDTFAPTAKFKSLTTVLSIAATNKWYMTGIDVENAFVEADIDRPIYMNLPADAYRNPDKSLLTVELKRSLYGLKQAPELWDRLLVDAISKLGFKQLMHDQCVYTYTDSSNNKVILVKYVDDIILTGNSKTLIDQIRLDLGKSFTKITFEDKIQRYVGIDIDYKPHEGVLRLSQRPHIQKLINKFSTGRSTSNPTIPPSSITPINPTYNYRVPGDGTNSPNRDLVGGLRFLADRTHPSLQSACSLLGSHAHQPSPLHLKGGEQVIKYLTHHKDDFIEFGGDPHLDLFGYADAAHVAGFDSKSQLGYCFFLNLNSGTIVAKSKKDSTVSHSSTEAEIKAIDLAIKEAIWLRGFLSELGYPQPKATTIFTDNKAAEILSNTNNITDLTNHLVLRINYIHQEQLKGTIKLKWINTENNVADILTKPLSYIPFHQHNTTLCKGHFGILPTPATITKRDINRQKKVKSIGNNNSI